MREFAPHDEVVPEVPPPLSRRRRLTASSWNWLRDVPRPVLAVTACYLGLLVCYSLLYPVYSGFDEPQHVDMTIALRHDPLTWPGPGERAVSQGVAASASIYTSRCKCPAEPEKPQLTGPYLASEVPARHERKTLQQLGGNAPTRVPPGYPNQMVQHPPLYYAVGAVVLGVMPYSESLAADQIVSVLRWTSVLMIAPLPLLAWATTRRLVSDGPIAVAASALPLAVPGLARSAGNVQNDNLTVLAMAVAFLLLARVVMGDISRRTAVGVGIAFSVALLSKGTALPLVPLVPLAYAVAWWRLRGPLPWRPATVAVLVSGIGGLWWLRNLLLYHAIQINGFGQTAFDRYERDALKIRPGPHDPSVWEARFNSKFHWYEWRFWSGLGSLDQNGLSFGVFRTLTVVTALGILLALIRGFGRGRADRGGVVVFALPVVLLTTLIALHTRAYYVRTGVTAAIQGRYAYPAIPALCALVAVGYGRISARAVRFLPASAFLAALLVQAIAIRGIFFGYWLPRTFTGGRLDRYRTAFKAVVAWSPWPAGVTVTAFAAAAVLAAAAAVSVLAPFASSTLRRRRNSVPAAL